jgi:Domain of unknown function (DUF1918)
VTVTVEQGVATLVGHLERRSEVEIVELVHPDGSPPYHVHWLDTGRITLVFPGPDSHIEHRSIEKIH